MRRKFITKQGGREAQKKIRKKNKQRVASVPNGVPKLPGIHFVFGKTEPAVHAVRTG
jgi:hypothetical protein